VEGWGSFCFGGSLGPVSSLCDGFFYGLEEVNGVISDAKSFKILLESSSSSMSGVGSLMMFLPAFTKELFFILSRYFSLEFDILDGGFLSQLYSILKSPLLKKLILTIIIKEMDFHTQSDCHFYDEFDVI
jgi:hypothetical protein